MYVYIIFRQNCSNKKYFAISEKYFAETMHYIAKVLCKGNPFHGLFAQLHIYIYTYNTYMYMCVYSVCVCVYDFPTFGLPFPSVSILCFWFTEKPNAAQRDALMTVAMDVLWGVCLTQDGESCIPRYTQKERERERREDICIMYPHIYIYTVYDMCCYIHRYSSRTIRS